MISNMPVHGFHALDIRSGAVDADVPDSPLGGTVRCLRGNAGIRSS